MLVKILLLSLCLGRDQMELSVSINHFMHVCFSFSHFEEIDSFDCINLFLSLGAGSYKTLLQVKSEQLGMGDKVRGSIHHAEEMHFMRS